MKLSAESCVVLGFAKTRGIRRRDANGPQEVSPGFKEDVSLQGWMVQAEFCSYRLVCARSQRMRRGRIEDVEVVVGGLLRLEIRGCCGMSDFLCFQQARSFIVSSRSRSQAAVRARPWKKSKVAPFLIVHRYCTEAEWGEV